MCAQRGGEQCKSMHFQDLRTDATLKSESSERGERFRRVMDVEHLHDMAMHSAPTANVGQIFPVPEKARNREGFDIVGENSVQLQS